MGQAAVTPGFIIASSPSACQTEQASGPNANGPDHWIGAAFLSCPLPPCGGGLGWGWRRNHSASSDPPPRPSPARGEGENPSLSCSLPPCGGRLAWGVSIFDEPLHFESEAGGVAVGRVQEASVAGESHGLDRGVELA